MDAFSILFYENLEEKRFDFVLSIMTLELEGQGGNPRIEKQILLW